jgi:L-galactose dehydrogenase
LKNAPVPREKYILATKLGRYPDGTFDFSAKRVIESVNDSLKKLGVDYIDVMQVHDFEFGSLDQVVKETLPALKQLKDEGKIRFIGITGFPLKIFDYVLANDKDNTVDSILSYCHCTLFNSTLLSLEPLLSEKKIGVINGGRH